MSEGCDLPMTYVVAMQKVEGSNPFSRFASNPLHMACGVRKPDHGGRRPS